MSVFQRSKSVLNQSILYSNTPFIEQSSLLLRTKSEHTVIENAKIHISSLSAESSPYSIDENEWDTGGLTPKQMVYTPNEDTSKSIEKK